MTAPDGRTRRTNGGRNWNEDDSRFDRLNGTRLGFVLVAITVGVGVLSYPEMPARMALHWRVGLDGTVSTATYVPRIVGTFLFAAVAASVLVLKVALERAIDEREPGLAVVFDGLLIVTLLGLGALQTLVVVLNAL